MQILRPGSRVRFVESEREAHVVCAIVFAHHVTYEVVWWADGDRIQDVVQAFEVELVEGDVLQVT